MVHTVTLFQELVWPPQDVSFSLRLATKHSPGSLWGLLIGMFPYVLVSETACCCSSQCRCMWPKIFPVLCSSTFCTLTLQHRTAGLSNSNTWPESLKLIPKFPEKMICSDISEGSCYYSFTFGSRNVLKSMGSPQVADTTCYHSKSWLTRWTWTSQPWLFTE